ncbi:MAG: enoyl-CoA hydratase [Desulfobacterales bacterium]|nr:enoyl-CoA hydratase [Desulfobacterales bacterium]
MEKPVLFEIKNNIATITLNRPEKRNALNQDLLVHFYNYLEDAKKNQDVNVIIITGSGTAFCAGLDLSAIYTDNLIDPRGDGKDFPDIIDACSKPIIGAVNGAAITGGFEIALNCDFLIASENAVFADTHAKVGIHPGWGMTQLLQQAVGKRMAKQLSFTCKYISAQEALNLGLVNKVVPNEELMPVSLQIASEINSFNQPMIRTIKKLIDYKESTVFENVFKHERQGFKKFMGGKG